VPSLTSHALSARTGLQEIRDHPDRKDPVDRRDSPEKGERMETREHLDSKDLSGFKARKDHPVRPPPRVNLADSFKSTDQLDLKDHPARPAPQAKKVFQERMEPTLEESLVLRETTETRGLLDNRAHKDRPGDRDLEGSREVASTAHRLALLLATNFWLQAAVRMANDKAGRVKFKT